MVICPARCGPALPAELRLIAAGVAACALWWNVAAAKGRSFEVADSIEMVRLVDPDPAAALFHRASFKVGPDGLSAIVVTRRGNLDTGLNEYQLLLFDGENLVRYLGRPDARDMPQPKVLATSGTASNRHGIDGARWIAGGSRVAFIGRQGDDPGQIYVGGVEDGSLHQITRHTGDIAAFDMTADAAVLIYSAYQTPDWSLRNEYGYAVGSESASDLATRDPRQASELPVRQFLVNRSLGAQAIELAVGSATTPSALALSPNGKWAVTMEPVRALPSGWQRYPLFDANQGAAKAFGTEPFGRTSAWLWQFMLVDTQTGAVRPLLNAPSATAGTMAQIHWSGDSASVVVAPTYLPLDSSASSGKADLEQAIAEIDIHSGRLAKVTSLASRLDDGRNPFLTGIDMLPGPRIRVHERAYSGEFLATREFLKHGGQWVAARNTVELDSRFGYEIAENRDRPPEIRVLDRETGQGRTITHLNPQLDAIDLGEVEAFRWRSGKLGVEYTGGLIKPRNYQPGRPYPIVLQTYGFRPEEFLVDGPNGMATAFAARALAGSGLMVLQMPQGGKRIEPLIQGREQPLDTAGEGELFQAMVESAIDELDALGLIDRTRIGLIGFSRTGMHVLHAITFSDYQIAAATIADSVAETPLSYALTYGASWPGMLEWEQSSMIGAPFWGEGVGRWLEKSPIFHLHRIRSPLRYEHLGTTVPAYWDVFAILKRHGRPVEMFHIPRGTHRLELPRTRYASQQGNVDWFRYWLCDAEDVDPAKAGQYARWRALRAQREAR